MPERTLVSQSNHHDGSTSPFANLFVQQQPPPLPQDHSTPSSPIPNSNHASVAAAAAAGTGILSGSSISSTSSTSSPPLTAVTSVGTVNYLTNFNPIIDEKHRFIDHAHQRRTLQVMNARLLQHAVNEAKMKPIIKAYLSNQYVDEEKTVIILTSKVAQKSYGTEKR
jgi:hypothetical protein